MPDTTHVIAGRCTTVFGTREQEHDMLVLVKPDETSELLVDSVAEDGWYCFQMAVEKPGI